MQEGYRILSWRSSFFKGVSVEKGVEVWTKIKIESKILKRVGPLAYQLELQPKLDRIHNVFHVPMLKKYHSNPSHVVNVEKIEIRPNFSFEEESISFCGGFMVLRKPCGSQKILSNNKILILF
ncbi:serine/threonine-protein phosphatase 6 regulatory ankyrin repeat subunit C-like [Gossypium australe]|uniref:Serine/threonine-protein phosphatase 6 regulatory ankyrin repeat subunit C-like n=1 Tax=Gossypium australe TaxID=47621 RepID=A0A5B6VB60_9ROSI|nr:serine/threonine-protein phosphatase 6 regulatory ankyrin repeat subunit C-like [Gossypium australe]